MFSLPTYATVRKFTLPVHVAYALRLFGIVVSRWSPGTICSFIFCLRWRDCSNFCLIELSVCLRKCRQKVKRRWKYHIQKYCRKQTALYENPVYRLFRSNCELEQAQTERNLWLMTASKPDVYQAYSDLVLIWTVIFTIATCLNWMVRSIRKGRAANVISMWYVKWNSTSWT